MHEAAIAEGILRAVRDAVPAEHLPRVQAVHVRIGVLRAVWPDALTFAYEALVRESALNGSRLDIQTVEATGTCRDCSAVFEVRDVPPSCPECESILVDLAGGMDLSVQSVTVEDGA